MVETGNGVAAVGVSGVMKVVDWLITTVGTVGESVGFTVGETSVGSMVDPAGWLASGIGAQANVINITMQNRISAFIVTSLFERFSLPESSDGLRSDCHLYPKGCCAKVTVTFGFGVTIIYSKASSRLGMSSEEIPNGLRHGEYIL